MLPAKEWLSGLATRRAERSRRSPPSSGTVECPRGRRPIKHEAPHGRGIGRALRGVQARRTPIIQLRSWIHDVLMAVCRTCPQELRPRRLMPALGHTISILMDGPAEIRPTSLLLDKSTKGRFSPCRFALLSLSSLCASFFRDSHHSVATRRGAHQYERLRSLHANPLASDV